MGTPAYARCLLSGYFSCHLLVYAGCSGFRGRRTSLFIVVWTGRDAPLVDDGDDVPPWFSCIYDIVEAG